MAERVSASIVIGGSVTEAQYEELLQLIADEALSFEWDGEVFEDQHRIPGEPLRLYAHEVAHGCFDALETWCVAAGLPFARWSGACLGQWGAQRRAFPGEGEPIDYPADEDDYVVLGRHKAEALGSFGAIVRYFDVADSVIPALIVVGRDQDHA